MKKSKMKCRVISALLAVLLCFSCIGSPAVFAAESGLPTPAPAGYDEDGSTVPNTESVPEDADAAGQPEESVPEQPETAAEDESVNFSDAAQAFIDAVDALDRVQILGAANTWGIAHKAWLADPENADLKAALDAAVAESDEAAASLYAAEDLYYEIPEDEQESEVVQAAYLSLMSLVVAMQQTMDNPTDPSNPGTEGGNEPPSGDEIAAILYGDLPDAPTDYYMGSYGLPVATGETKISIGEWAGELFADSTGRMNTDAFNAGNAGITVPLQAGGDYAIVPVMVQVEYPANGSSSRVILPDGVVLLSQDGSGKPASAGEAVNILNSTYTESSAAASGILVQASEDFTARFVYETPDGTVLEKSLTVHLDKGTTTTDPVLYNLPRKSAVYAERPTPSTTSGRITQVQQVNGTWLIWFNGQEAYCCDHGLTGKADGCPTYSYSHTSIVEGSQYTPGDHYRNQVEIWGGLNQLALGFLKAEAATFAARSEDENAADCYDDVQQWIMANYPDSVAAQAYRTALEALTSGSSTYATDTDYYCYIYQPPIGGWQNVAVIGPPVDGEEPEPEPEFFAEWSAPAQTVSGSFDFRYTINADKQQLVTGEKVDGATIEIEPITKSGTIDGGSWTLSPASRQVITTSGHTMDDAYHTNGGDGLAAWSLHYSVSKTSGTRSGSVGPYPSQSEADAAADSARANAINELRGEAQAMVDAAVASAKSQLANLRFRFVETGVPFGFKSYTGTLGSNQTIIVPANVSKDYVMRNAEWSLQVKLDKRDSETGNRIAADTAFAVFEWDTVLQRYIPHGGYNQYVVELQPDGTYMVVNHSGYATADPASRTMYYTQRNEGKFILVETTAPTGYYGDWSDVSHPGEAGSVKGKRAYFVEITADNDGSVIWLDNADYNANIGTANKGGTLLDTGNGIVSVTISDSYLPASKTYITDKSGIAANEDGRTVQPVKDKFLNDRTLGEIVLSKVDLDALRYLAAGSNGNTTLEGAVYDLYAAEDIRHPDGVTGVVDYAKITDADDNPIWHTTVLTNGGWDDSHLPVLKKDHLVASAAIKDGKLAFANLYLGKYYLVERATGLVLPLDANGQIVLDASYPILSRQLLPSGKTRPLAINAAGEYTDYVYKNRYSAVAEGRALDGTRTYDGYYLSFANGYLCDEINHYVTLTYAGESGLVVREDIRSEDEVLKSGFSINKLVSTTGQPGPAIKLDGAGFTVFRISDLSRADQFTRNPNGSYQVQSILDAYRADGYDQDTPKYDFSNEKQAIATMYEGSTATVDAYNSSLTAGMDNANGSGMGWRPTSKPGEYRLSEIFTNSEGILRVDGLAYGQYLVVETTVPRDVFQAAPFIVIVDSNAPQSVFSVPQGSVTESSGSYMTFNVLDEELEGYLQLIKVDAETGKAVKLARTAFSIYRINEDGSLEIVEMNDPANGSATAKTNVFYTDENGFMKTPEKLPLGRYRVVEVQGPQGCYNDSAYFVDFEITSERVYEVIGSSANSMDDFIVTERYVNHETLGRLTLRKMGEVLTGWHNGQFTYEMDALPGAVYEVRAHGDIATADHQTDANGNRTLWYADGDLVATVTTGADGQIDKAEFAPPRTPATYDFLAVTHDGSKGEVSITLPLGSYDVREVQAPYGYTLTDTTYTVTFGWNDQSNEVVLAETIVSHADGKNIETTYQIVNAKDASGKEIEAQKLVFENEREKARVGVFKIDKETGKYLAGAVFELYTANDIYDASDNLILSADSLIATSPETNADGYTYFKADIPIRGEQYGTSSEKNASTNSGNYYVVEKSAPAGHYLNKEPMLVTFTYDGEAIKVLDSTCSNAPTEMWVSKQDITNGEELPGATLRIEDKDGETIEEWVSSEEPQKITGLHLDEVYTLVEQTAPDGYLVAESIRFKLVQKTDEDGNLLDEVDIYICTGKDWLIFNRWEKLDDTTVVMLDAPAPEVWVSKQDITNGKELPGASLRIEDKDGETIEEWISGEEPQKITGLHTDEVYTLVEQIAPDGYLVAESIRFKLVQKTDEDGSLLNEVDVYVCTGKNWLIFDHWEKLDDTTVVMLDARKPDEPKPTPKPDEPTPTPTPAPQPIPQTGDLLWLPALLVVTGTLCAAAYALWMLIANRKKNKGDAESDTSNQES